MDVEALPNADINHAPHANGRYDGLMQLRLYDTKKKELQPLEPLKPGHVGIYLCGPTVQGDPHIGHLRAAVAFDVLIRWLHRNGLETTYIRNITDIDDKILNKAKAEGVPWWALATRYERAFERAYQTLGLLPATYEPHATAHIPEQIALAQRLIERGHAYADETGNVYFDVHSQPDYGSLTHQALADMRITEDDNDVDEQREAGKRDPRDFALWKSAKEDEPDTAIWDSPWGPGRPGWHLECSAMSRKYLGESFDIHGGGIDLRFPHHENEQAQSHAAGWDFARHWVHNAWVTQAGDKMSKSLGNTLALDTLLESFPAPVIRFALCTVHYRSTIEWSDGTLTLAQAAWDKLAGFVSEMTAKLGDSGRADVQVGDLPVEFSAAMDDDLNVAGALAVIYQHVKSGRRALAEKDSATALRELSVVRSMLDILGLDPVSWESADGGSAEHEALDKLVAQIVTARDAARADRDWKRADQLRDQLTAAGIVTQDGADGSTWRLS